MNTELKITELLPQSFRDSLKNEATGCLSDIMEVGLDSILEDSVIKDIPFISTAISIYHMGTSVRDRHNLKKLAVFLDTMNQHIQDEDARKKYAKKFEENRKFRTQELEFILILTDRYIRYDKPQMLAKLYLAYLNEDITWNEFSVYAEIIDRFLPGDAELLCTELPLRINLEKERADSSARLVSLGLMSEHIAWGNISGGSLKSSDGEDKGYRMTKFGKKLSSILR